VFDVAVWRWGRSGLDVFGGTVVGSNVVGASEEEACMSTFDIGVTVDIVDDGLRGYIKMPRFDDLFLLLH